MYRITLILALAFLAGPGFSQTATDFTCNDCTGTSHNLFNKLDAGKVIVICWVMPCGACIAPSMTTYNVVQSYQTSHPNRVDVYYADDYANTNCSSLTGWLNSNNMPAASFRYVFSNSAIDMAHYGAAGMPKIVVIGKSSHTVYYNTNNTVDPNLLQDAIDAALATPTGMKEDGGSGQMKIFPNPSAGSFSIALPSQEPGYAAIEISDITGRAVFSLKREITGTSMQWIPVNTSSLASGLYNVNITTGGKRFTEKLVITN